MTFEDLCLMCEGNYSVTLIKGNYGNSLTSKEYDQTIKNYVAKKLPQGYSRINLFLNNPNNPDACFLNLNYYAVPSMDIQAKNYKYEIPRSTLNKLRASPDVYNESKGTFLQSRTNVFFLKGSPIQKVFPENRLQSTMENLIKVNNVFKSYGKQFEILGGIYGMEDENAISRLKSGFEKTKEGWKNMPRDVRSWWDKL